MDLFFCDDINSSNAQIDDKDIYVYWSGGCDSTALLYKLATIYPNNNIKAVSVISDGIYNAKADSGARKKIKKKFQQLKIKNITYLTFKISYDYLGGYCGLGQPALWLSSLSSILTGTEKAVCFGYVREDDIWHYIEPFKKVFYNMAQITGCVGAELYFPTAWMHKKDIVKYLKEYDLLHLCNFCESRESDDESILPCGYCASCRKMIYAEQEIAFEEQKEQETEVVKDECVAV